jgi:hypothetical protein
MGWLLAIGYWLSAVGYRLLATGNSDRLNRSIAQSINR